MLLEGSSIRFSREEAARALALPPQVIDALVATRTVTRDGSDVIVAAELERLLRDTLLRLYRAEAQASEMEMTLPEGIEVEEPLTRRSASALSRERERVASEATPGEGLSNEDDLLVTHSLADFQRAQEAERANLRLAPRYTPRRHLGGTFRQVKFSVLQLSATGLRIRHDDTLRPGDSARLAFALVRPARSFALQARVVWTSIAQRGNGPSFCISGLRVTGGEEQLREAIRILLAARELDPEEATTSRNAPQSPAAITGLSDEDVASIIRTLRLLTSNPVEANRWYTRARFALADESVRAVAPVRARDREEALAVWEYLGRRVTLKAVAGVLSWIRQTRSAAAVT